MQQDRIRRKWAKCSVDGTVLVPVRTHRQYPNDANLGRCLKDRYAIFDMLGVGGFGAVYRALDQATGLHVAVKTIHQLGQDARIDGITRLLQEARILTQLKSIELLMSTKPIS